MSVLEEIRLLSRADALQALEALWERLSESEDEMDSPAWHGEELARREKLIAEGRASFSDWEDAKERIRNRVK